MEFFKNFIKGFGAMVLVLVGIALAVVAFAFGQAILIIHLDMDKDIAGLVSLVVIMGSIAGVVFAWVTHDE